MSDRDDLAELIEESLERDFTPPSGNALDHFTPGGEFRRSADAIIAAGWKRDE